MTLVAARIKLERLPDRETNVVINKVLSVSTFRRIFTTIYVVAGILENYQSIVR